MGPTQNKIYCQIKLVPNQTWVQIRDVMEIDGHDMDDVVRGLDFLVNNNDNPAILIANTIKGKGVSFMEDNPAFHGAAPNDEQFKLAMNELGEVMS